MKKTWLNLKTHMGPKLEEWPNIFYGCTIEFTLAPIAHSSNWWIKILTNRIHINLHKNSDPRPNPFPVKFENAPIHFRRYQISLFFLQWQMKNYYTVFNTPKVIYLLFQHLIEIFCNICISTRNIHLGLIGYT